MKNKLSKMLLISSLSLGFLSLGGCVAVPDDGYYYSSGYYNNNYSTTYSNGNYYYNNPYDYGYYDTVPAYSTSPTIILNGSFSNYDHNDYHRNPNWNNNRPPHNNPTNRPPPSNNRPNWNHGARPSSANQNVNNHTHSNSNSRNSDHDRSH